MIYMDSSKGITCEEHLDKACFVLYLIWGSCENKNLLTLLEYEHKNHINVPQMGKIIVSINLIKQLSKVIIYNKLFREYHIKCTDRKKSSVVLIIKIIIKC